MRKTLLMITSAAMMACACSQSQQNQEKFTSTVVNPDGTVTFYYRNDNAKEVAVSPQYASRTPMQKDPETGIWSATTGPAEPDMYPYSFIVDGVSVMDPANPQFFPNEGFKNSILDIPGKDAPLIHSIQNVPHGNVEYINYYSQAIQAYNNAIVYTPPRYEESSDSYPVFYLISGTTDTEEVYYKVGRMNYILDNLLAQGLAKEMIIVLPYGNPSKLMTTAPKGMQDLFGNDLINDLMPYIESHYRTINDRDHRAIGGFSRGGNQGLLNGLTHLDKFSYLCSYSSFTTTDIPDVYDNAEETNSKIHLFWTGVGTDDFLYGSARDYTEFLDNKGIRCIKEYTTGKFGHTWMNAKYFLDKTMRLLFNPEASEAAMANAQPTKPAVGTEQPFTPSTMSRIFPRTIASPVFNDNNITFNINAPAAEKVMFEGEMTGVPTLMAKDEFGTWSISFEDLEPDVYCYNFIVDGTEVADAQNMYLAPDNGFKRSVLNMPDEAYNVNKACIDYTPVRYSVETLKDGSQHCYASVCPEGAENAPLIALIAGPEDSFESWFKIAHANIILDQMMAAGECGPCRLILTDSKVKGAKKSINSGNFGTWAEARQELVNTLRNLK